MGRDTVPSGERILVSGASGQVARSVVHALTKRNEVWCVGRFEDARVRESLQQAGAKLYHWDLRHGDLSGLPSHFSKVMHAAAYRGTGEDVEDTIDVNSAGIGALMYHCRDANSFLFVSSGAVYADPGGVHLRREGDPLSGESRWLPTYAVMKVAAEGAVRAFSATFELPTTIARLNAAYGEYGHGGIPVIFYRQMLAGEPIAVPESGLQHYCNPIHSDDIAKQVPLLWEQASLPATVINWGGDDVVGVQDLMSYISKCTSTPVEFRHSPITRAVVPFDNSKRTRLIGECDIDWRDGVLRALKAHFPHISAADQVTYSFRPRSK